MVKECGRELEIDALERYENVCPYLPVLQRYIDKEGLGDARLYTRRQAQARCLRGRLR
jgi:hypothetical protein